MSTQFTGESFQMVNWPSIEKILIWRRVQWSVINVKREDTVKCFAWEVQLTLIMCSRMVFRRTFDDDIGHLKLARRRRRRDRFFHFNSRHQSSHLDKNTRDDSASMRWIARDISQIDRDMSHCRVIIDFINEMKSVLLWHHTSEVIQRVEFFKMKRNCPFCELFVESFDLLHKLSKVNLSDDDI